MTVTAVTSLSQFREIISRDKVSVFYFWAPWSSACNSISPAFEGYSNDGAYGTIGFYKVNVDENSDIGSEGGIQTMPTFIIFKNGAQVGISVGGNPAALKALVATAVNSK